MARTASQMVADAKQQVENLTVEQVAAEISANDLLLVDIREPHERRDKGSIPGAVSAPRGMLEFWADPSTPYHREEFDPAGRTILYCASGGRSALGAAALRQLGYNDVAHLDGGMKAWKEAGCPVVRPES